MYDCLKVQNFTLFEDAEIDFVKGINAYVGANGIGKTHILKLLYLCELKDPECSGAVNHPPTTGLSHRQRVFAKLTGTAFPNEFAKNAFDTVQNHVATRSAANRTFIVVIAIFDPTFDIVMQQSAALVIQRDLNALGSPMSVLVVNIAEWNSFLAPRKMKRVP